VALHPQGSIQNELRLATEAYRTGDLGSATALIDRLLGTYPDDADVQLAKGVIQVACGDPAGGLHWLVRSLRTKSDVGEALAWSAVASLSLGRFGDAERFAGRLTDIDPRSARAHYLLASSLRGLERTEEALRAIDRSLTLNPEDPESMVLKARLLSEWNLPALAMDFYRKSMAIRPTPSAAVDLARILVKEGHPREALDILDEVVPGMPIESRPHALVARAFTVMRQFDEAEEHWRMAERFDREPDAVVQIRARAEIAVGRFEVAEELLIDAIAQERQADACFSILCTAKKMSPGDLPLIHRMAALLDKDKIGGLRSSNLNFALGKCFDDLRDFEKAIRCFDEANRICYELYPKRKSFDRGMVSRFTDFQIATFTSERIEDLSEFGLPSRLPILVTGMIRSGTTLTENILSAHSLVRGAGEQAFWPERSFELFHSSSGSLEFKHSLAMQFATEYLRWIDPGEERMRHVVDKNPGNIDLAGMLSCVFPGAKMVHIKRHPVDNLLSMWMTPVSGDVEWASVRKNLVFIYREYVRLYKHSQRAIPKDWFATFRYEDLTSHPDKTIRAMLEFVGLEPEASCFAPERNTRAVLTPSVQQVRQPIHQSSQERWKNYEPWLGAFAELLEDEECA
jgi:tetratricopeptide (TPR) repeat protein